MPVLAVTASAWVVVVVADSFGWATGRTPASGSVAASDAVAVGSTADAAVLADAGLVGAAGTHHTLVGVAGPLGHSSHGTFTGFLVAWTLMLTAMMAPLLIPALRHAYARSLPRRRWRAMTLVTAAYAGTWLAAGLVLLALATAVHGVVDSVGQAGAAGFPERGDVAFLAGLVILLLWQASPAKQRCLNRHHAHPPLAAFGWAADRDALSLGGSHAAWCFGSCWALMLLPLLAPGGHLVVMVLVTAWMWAERLDRPTEPAWQVRLPRRALRLARRYTQAYS